MAALIAMRSTGNFSAKAKKMVRAHPQTVSRRLQAELQTVFASSIRTVNYMAEAFTIQVSPGKVN